MDKDTKDFLVALFNKLWDNINNKDTRLWTFLSIYGGGVALAFTVGKLANFELYAFIVILVLTMWALSIVANATWWDLRNRLMIGGIENRFPGSLPGVIPSFYRKLRFPEMDALNRLSVNVLGIVALAMYLRTMWPFFRQNSITSWESLVPIVVLYMIAGAAVWWWVGRIDDMITDFYHIARKLREEASFPPQAVPPVLPEPGSPLANSLEDVLRSAADGVVEQARAAVNAPGVDIGAASPVLEAAQNAIQASVNHAQDEFGPQLAALLQQAAVDAATRVATAAAQFPAGQAPPPAAAWVAAGAQAAVAGSATAAINRQVLRPNLDEFTEKEKASRRRTSWRGRGLVVLLCCTAIFDIACSKNTVDWCLPAFGLFFQVVALALYIGFRHWYYYRPDAVCKKYHLKLVEEDPGPSARTICDYIPWAMVACFLLGVVCWASSVVMSKDPLPMHAGPGATAADLRLEREKISDQLEALRQRAADLEEIQRKHELSRFLTKDEGNKFLNRDEAKTFISRDEAQKQFAPKSELDALRRNLSPKKEP